MAYVQRAIKPISRERDLYQAAMDWAHGDGHSPDTPANIAHLSHLSEGQLEEKFDKLSTQFGERNAVLRLIKDGNSFLIEVFSDLEKDARMENPNLKASLTEKTRSK